MSSILEVSVIALTICSAVTTFVGALRLVSHLWAVALLFTIGVQGGMYTVAHTISLTRDGGKRKCLGLACCWALLAFFSVYASALGMLELQKDRINNDHSHVSMQAEWRRAADQLLAFQIGARQWVTEASLNNKAATRVEREKNAQAEARKQFHSGEARTRLVAESADLNQARKALDKFTPLPTEAPPSLNESRTRLDAAYAAAATVYAEMPSGFRAAHPLPRPGPAEFLSDDTQEVFLAQLRSGATRVSIVLLIAFLLDFITVIMLWAHKPTRRLSEKILAARINQRAIWGAFTNPIQLHREHLRIAIEPYGQFGTLSLGTDGRVIYARDLEGAFRSLERTIEEERGRGVQIVSITTPAGAEIVPDLPLLSQLDGDLIRLHVAERDRE